MSLLTPVNAARIAGAGRIGIGALLMVAPERVGRTWLGDDGTTPAAIVLLRALGIRDALVGMAVAHTADDPQRGYRWARTSSFADIVDLTATVAASRHLPKSGAAATAVLAGSAAVGHLALSRWMRAA
ncbi:MAG: hypothetical protein M0P31_17250 [Solirubrobacteraceae bacterium]|nr:hypothetical protein [Solirubrobacteraceae bacterium]